MTKTLRHKYRRNKSRRHNKSRKSIKSRKHRSYKKRRGLARGPNSDPISPDALVSCAMCDKKFPRNTMLVPSGCPGTFMPERQKGKKRMYADRSHRVCQKCWWGDPGKPESGFAHVDGPHGCPGCKRGLAPNPPLKQLREVEVIDLLSSSD
jgi:hypothetical protein